MDLLKKLGHKLEDKVENIFHGGKESGGSSEQHGHQHHGQPDEEGPTAGAPSQPTKNRFQSFAPQSSGHAKW